jgi:Co/Zn/Cd efflux system component
VKKSDNEYTFGYIKIETLSGLFNGMFLIFIAFDILFESIGRIYEPQAIDHDTGLLSVSILGLMVNMVGLFFFHEHH